MNESGGRRQRRRHSLPTEDLAQIEAHKVRWEGKLKEIMGSKKNNNQVLTREKISEIIDALETYDLMDWKVWVSLAIYRLCFSGLPPSILDQLVHVYCVCVCVCVCVCACVCSSFLSVYSASHVSNSLSIYSASQTLI